MKLRDFLSVLNKDTDALIVLYELAEDAKAHSANGMLVSPKDTDKWHKRILEDNLDAEIVDISANGYGKLIHVYCKGVD